MAATAATRLGLAPTCAHRDRTRVHGDGRDNRDEDADEPVVHMTPGDRRDHRPALNPVMLDVMVEHQAGIPLLLNPLSGNSSDGRNCGQVVRAPMAQVHTTDGPTSLVADSALYRADKLQKLSETQMTWITRVPATWRAAHAPLAQAEPQTMAPLTEG
jgi:transposase